MFKKTCFNVKLLTEGLPGIHQRFIPKKRFVCSRESTKRFLRFFPGNDAKRTLVSKLHIYHHCSENLMRFWHLLIDRPCLVKNLKTWWELSENLVNFQNLMKDLVKKPSGFTIFFWKLGEIWKPGENLAKTGWKPGEFTIFFGENLVKFENLVKTWWIHPIFFGENLVKFENLVNTWWIHPFFWENLVKFENLAKTCWKPGEFTKFFLVKTW